uniref:Rrp4, putative n=1 Tax=Arundo donax TaxID=35708 RepID=A0A0A9GDG3_ARUDO
MSFISTFDDALASAVSIISSIVKVNHRAESTRTALASWQICFLVSTGVKFSTSVLGFC